MRLASMAVRSEATSVPASAPMAAESAHPSISIVPALMPCRRAESGLEATARSFRPTDVRLSSNHRPRHCTSSTASRPRVSFWMRVSNRNGTLPRGKGDGMVCGSVPKMSCTRALSPRNRPSVMMTTFSGLRPSMGRMSVRPITAPATKANAIEMKIATHTGMPVVVSFQETKAEKSAISPWAKLRTPVVRKISTRARATEANTTPLPRPLITWLMNSSMRDPSESQVGLADGLVVVQLMGRALHRHTTGLEHVAPVADVECEVGVLLDHQDGQALVAVEVAQPGEQLAGDEGSQAERRLVEQQQAGRGHHRPGEGEHLLLAAAHAAGLLRPALAQTGEHVVPALQVAPDLAVTAGGGPDAPGVARP